jgi:carboxyl-terminal processing protease
MFFVTSALAADNGSPARTDEAEASHYAQHLDYTINVIVEDYVRPVTRPELLTAALAGMYEAAGVTAPPSLKADIQAAKTDSEQVELMRQTRKKLGNVEALKGTNALVVSIRAMCKSLDPYSALMTGEELLVGVRDETTQGFGLECQENTGGGPVQIKSVLPGSPAQKAGLRPGDRITEINGQPPDLKSFALTPSKLPSIPGQQLNLESIELTANRPSTQTTWKVQLAPAAFRAETVWGAVRRPDNGWNYMLDPDRRIALVRVGSLSEGTSAELEEVLTGLYSQGIRGLILDLRWSPGGIFNEAIACARLFLGEDRIAKIKTRNGMDRDYTGKRDVNFLNFAMIVLVNGQTSGGAELIAAALQDNHRALVAGQRSLGKASVQTTKALRIANMGLKLTSGTFIRPSGKNLHRFPDSLRTDDWGVLPESKLEFRISSELDQQLREWYVWQTLRPGSAKEVLPLDDPAADPQRQMASKALVEKIKSPLPSPVSAR